MKDCDVTVRGIAMLSFPAAVKTALPAAAELQMGVIPRTAAHIQRV
jgi:hypothetical protein